MKKNVIALAVAAAMVAPAAMAEVKVSGALQAEIVSWSGDNVAEGLTMNDAQEGGTTDKGNFGALNFSASEDLGNGMKAIAKIGFKINATNHYEGTAATQTMYNRDAYVGLSGSFGTVMAGTMSTPYKMTTVKWDPFLATSAQARSNYGASGLHNGYASNAIAYANKFGMAQVAVAMVIDERIDTAGDRNGEHAISAGLNMPVGPVELALGYHSVGDVDTTVADEAGTATKVGVKYAAGAMGVAFTYESLVDGLIENGDGDETIMLLSGTYTVGANTFALNYGQTETDNSTLVNTSVGVVHSFSKSTSAHVGYTALDHDGSDDSGIAVGMRVKF